MKSAYSGFKHLLDWLIQHRSLFVPELVFVHQVPVDVLDEVACKNVCIVSQDQSCEEINGIMPSETQHSDSHEDDAEDPIHSKDVQPCHEEFYSAKQAKPNMT